VILFVLLLVVIALAGVVALVVVRALQSRPAASDTTGLPADVVGLRQEVAALRAEAAGAIRHLGLVRYDAFADVGGRLSWSVALADDGGNGVVLTAIHGRSEARSYAKSISGWASEQQLSPEEDSAVAAARP